VQSIAGCRDTAINGWNLRYRVSFMVRAVALCGLLGIPRLLAGAALPFQKLRVQCLNVLLGESVSCSCRGFG
jgi:hypothetical protein